MGYNREGVVHFFVFFQKPKWKSYYGSKPWYAARNASAEQYFTEIEKANIALVRRIQSEMAANEAAYTKPEFSLYEFY
ncbi:MAG: hypothetical protein U0176_10485 [Bacteroidia bacterium]